MAGGEVNVKGNGKQQNRVERLWLDLAADSMRNSENGSSEDYTLPNDYQNLDEITAPSPIESPEEDRRQGYLEDRSAGRSSEDNLNEIAAPSPVDNSFDERGQGVPEARRFGLPSTVRGAVK